jgi:hypothetical protein
MVEYSAFNRIVLGSNPRQPNIIEGLKLHQSIFSRENKKNLNVLVTRSLGENMFILNDWKFDQLFLYDELNIQKFIRQFNY